MTQKNWFEVDKDGLKQLQDGKNKTFVIRELIQNAIDEDIKVCILTMIYHGYNRVTISVEDDSPIGFRDLSDAYILYRSTYKRADATKRGRFNLGEKQVFSVCNSAEILTTTGGLLFNKDGRKTTRKKRERGSIITVELNMTASELDECFVFARNILIPDNISFKIVTQLHGAEQLSENIVRYREPKTKFEATLKTELDENGVFKRTSRKTKVHIHNKTDDVAMLYELGIPVCEIDCDYSIDVQQKIPLSSDRDSVLPGFMKDLYAEVLNVTHNEINADNASSLWVRDATTSSRINRDAVKDVIEQRYGSDVVIANPFDRVSIDEAISNGFKIIYGNELSSDEWANIKKYDLLESSSEKFGKDYVDFILVKPTEEQLKVGQFIKKVGKEYLGINIDITYLSSPNASTVADFTLGGSDLRLNVPKMNFMWSDNGRVSQPMLDLIIHELGHHEGLHYEQAYHKCLTMLGSKLTLRALTEPKFFKL